MAMVFCRGCGKEIHESAPTCPHCGFIQNVSSSKLSKSSLYAGLALAAVLLGGGTYWLGTRGGDKPTKPEQELPMGSESSNAEQAAWEKAGVAASISGYSEYLRKHPSGKYAPEAAKRIAALEKAAQEKAAQTKSAQEKQAKIDAAQGGMCIIQGNNGSCGVEPFYGGEAPGDKNGHTCRKFTGARYIGTCRDGLLDNVGVIYRKSYPGNIPMAIIAPFNKGRIVYPYALHYLKDNGEVDSRYGNSKVLYGCVLVGYDISETDKGCLTLKRMFGWDILSSEFNQKLRRKEIDIPQIQYYYQEYLNSK